MALLMLTLQRGQQMKATLQSMLGIFTFYLHPGDQQGANRQNITHEKALNVQGV